MNLLKAVFGIKDKPKKERVVIESNRSFSNSSYQRTRRIDDDSSSDLLNPLNIASPLNPIWDTPSYETPSSDSFNGYGGGDGGGGGASSDYGSGSDSSSSYDSGSSSDSSSCDSSSSSCD